MYFSTYLTLKDFELIFSILLFFCSPPKAPVIVSGVVTKVRHTVTQLPLLVALKIGSY